MNRNEFAIVEILRLYDRLSPAGRRLLLGRADSLWQAEHRPPPRQWVTVAPRIIGGRRVADH